ncbi:MAG: galactose-1-phosphate uridylyltransferase, partial [Pseudomonadota bacterium]
NQSGSALLTDYIAQELQRDVRFVCENEDFVVLVPYWATWPFETLLCSKRHVARLPQLSGSERRSLADIIRCLSIRYDNLFGVSFPYSSGLHQAPASGAWDDSFSLHMHFFPPLLRSAEVRKFMVGYEMLAEAQRDLLPEDAAKILRKQNDEHVLQTATGSV